MVVLSAVQIFCDVGPCRQGQQLQHWLTLQTTAIRSFQMSINIYQSRSLTPQETQKFSVRCVRKLQELYFAREMVLSSLSATQNAVDEKLN